MEQHHRVLLSSLLLAIIAADSGTEDKLRAVLDEAAQRVSEQYNCSVSIALRSSYWTASAARGPTDTKTGRPGQTTDAYAWGSVTKMLTAASVMKLISEGAFKLDDAIGPLVDPLLRRMATANPKQNFTAVSDLWGDHIKQTTVRQLLSMRAGVPDFDTATPRPGPEGLKDPLRAEFYASPNHVYTPIELMSVPWVAGNWNSCRFGFCYSSTNFILLGLVIAAHRGAESWANLDQSSFLPAQLRGTLAFADTGAPKNYTPVHGYDRTSYNVPKGTTSNHDNWSVDGVFSGWTASNIVASAPHVAELAWELYGPPSSIAPREFMQQMIPHGPMHFYGLGTFNLGMLTGKRGKYGQGYGHLGATYGYQSIAGYFPGAEFSMAVATNIETDLQPQPSEALCYAYNGALGVLHGQAVSCTFSARGFFGGTCKCQQQLDQEFKQQQLQVFI